MTQPPPIALTIAGSDCSAGAGIQADLKTFQHFGVHGLSAITSVIAETPHEVRRLEHVAMPLLQDQIHILLDSYPVHAIKTGLLPTRMCIIALAEILKNHDIPLVIDPVTIASTGNPLADADAGSSLCSRLLPISTLVTPNIPEAETILQRKITSVSDLESAARDISNKHQTSCLLKGGHLPGVTEHVDILWHDNTAHLFRHPHIDIPHGIHGTGCTLSSAITAGIALGQSLENATENAINYVQNLISHAHTWHHHGKTIQSLGW